MQHGVHVHLDPRGGNQLNVREALRLLNPPDTPASDSEASSTSSSVSPEPRRSALDDYDYDDDFIDDGDLLHDEEVPPTPTSSLEASDAQTSDVEPNPGDSDDDDDDNPDGNDDEDDTHPQHRSKLKPISSHYQNKNVVTHGFTTFYVSRGQLPAKSAVETVITVPPTASRLGNVVIDFPPHARKRFEQQFPNTSAPSEDCPLSSAPSPGDSSSRVPTSSNPNVALATANTNANESASKHGKETPAPPTPAPPTPAPPTPAPPTLAPPTLAPPTLAPPTLAPPTPAPPTPAPPTPTPPTPAPSTPTRPSPGGTTVASTGIAIATTATTAATAAAATTTTTTTTTKSVAYIVPQKRKVPVSPSPSGGSSKPTNDTNASRSTVPVGNVSKTGGKRHQPPLFPPPIAAAIAKLQSVCIERFGDKKPKLDDLPLQQQLYQFFRVVIDAGSAKLHSEIKKEKRLVALEDNIWSALSSFLRTKRVSLEAMGHALIWSDVEKEAMSAVDKAENAIASFVAERQKELPTGSVTLERTGPIEDLIFSWYTAKSELLDAKNQLASRYKTAKKSLPGWVSSLKKQMLMNCSLTESDILDMIRLLEDRKAAQRRVNINRKRKRKPYQFHPIYNPLGLTPDETSPRVLPADINQDSDNPAKKAAVENTSSTSGKPAAPKKAFVRMASAKKVSKKAPSSLHSPNDNNGTNYFPRSFVATQTTNLPPPQTSSCGSNSKASIPKPIVTKDVTPHSASSAQKSSSASVSVLKALPSKSVPKVVGKTPPKPQPRLSQKSGARPATKVLTKTNSRLESETRPMPKGIPSSLNVKPLPSGGGGNRGGPKTVPNVQNRKKLSTSIALRTIEPISNSTTSKLGSAVILGPAGNSTNKRHPQLKESLAGSTLERKIILSTHKASTETTREKEMGTASSDVKGISPASNSVAGPHNSLNPAQTTDADEQAQTAAMPPSSTE